MPGFDKPVMIGAHTIPYFKDLIKMEKGDTIKITHIMGFLNIK